MHGNVRWLCLVAILSAWLSLVVIFGGSCLVAKFGTIFDDCMFGGCVWCMALYIWWLCYEFNSTCFNTLNFIAHCAYIRSYPHAYAHIHAHPSILRTFTRARTHSHACTDSCTHAHTHTLAHIIHNNIHLCIYNYL